MSAQSGGAGGGAGGGDAYDSATLRATGTFSNKGTVLGTPKSGRAHLGSSSSAYSASAQKSSVFGSPAQPISAGGGNKMTAYSYDSYSASGGGGGGGGGGGDYDQTSGMNAANYQSNTLSAGGGGMSKFSTSTMSSYNYQVCKGEGCRTVSFHASGMKREYFGSF